MRISLLIILIAISFLTKSQTLVLDKIKVYTNSNTTVPAVIFQSNANVGLPLVIFCHGMGEAGITGVALWNQGLPLVLKNGFKPPFPCVIIAPQRSSYSVSPDWLPNVILDAIARFKIDTTRIYVTGISAGGWATYGSQLNLTPEFAKRIAAIVPLSAATQDQNKNNFAQYIAPTWAIVGGNDISYKEQNEDMIKRINTIKPGLAKIDIRSGIGHSGWTEIYTGAWKGSDGQTIWDFLKDKKTGNTPTPLPPATVTIAYFDSVVNIKNKEITTLKNSLTILNGDFNILKIEYERVLGILNNIISQICTK